MALSGLILAPAQFQMCAVDGGEGAVEGAAKEHEGRRYLILVSGARQPVRVRVRVPVPAQGARVLVDRDRTVPVRDGLLEDELRGYGTTVYALE